MPQASLEMPRYRCHKEVYALKIANIIKFTESDSEGNPGGAQITPENKRYGAFQVDSSYMEKHKPEVGGYYVVYKDGYKSYSPAQAFEEGYSEI